VGAYEVEEYVLRAGGVLEDRKDRRHGSPDVCGVERHCHVDCFLGTYVGVGVSLVVKVVVCVGDGGAIWGVVEFGGLFELVDDGGGG